MLQDLLRKAVQDDVVLFALVAFATLVALCGLIIVVVYIAATNWRKCRQHQLDVSLKRDMLDRGMSADEIERVLGAKSPDAAKGPDGPVAYPTPSEVVVEQDGEWYAAILLKSDGGKYFVHYKGYDEEEWVTIDRIRFPAQPHPAATSDLQHQPV